MVASASLPLMRQTPTVVRPMLTSSPSQLESPLVQAVLAGLDHKITSNVTSLRAHCWEVIDGDESLDRFEDRRTPVVDPVLQDDPVLNGGKPAPGAIGVGQNHRHECPGGRVVAATVSPRR